MNMVKTLASALILTATASSASALTVVINLENRIDSVKGPTQILNEQTLAYIKQQPVFGQVVINQFEQYRTYDRKTRTRNYVTTSLDFDNAPNAGIVIGGSQLNTTFDAGSRWVANPNFNPTLKDCSERDINRGRNGCTSADPVNPKSMPLSEAPANYGKLLGNGKIEIVEGLLKEVTWSMDRQGKVNPNYDPTKPDSRRNQPYLNSLTSYDNIFKSSGVGFLLSEVSLKLSNFTIDTEKSAHDVLFLNADQYLTVTVQDVQEIPVPAAAWLFGSAMLGLVGIKRRK